jgi:hypothetical protein
MPRVVGRNTIKMRKKCAKLTNYLRKMTPNHTKGSKIKKRSLCLTQMRVVLTLRSRICLRTLRVNLSKNGKRNIWTL